MDSNRTGNHELFSRGPTPPNQQHALQRFSPPAQLPSNSSPNQIDALFQNIAGPVTQQPSQPPRQQQQQQAPQSQPLQSSIQGSDNVHTVSSAPVTPVMALKDESPAPASSASASERQNALLSLLGGSAGPTRPAAQTSTASLPAQVPTPPESSQRSNASPGHNENQGKILLEQLMSGYVQFALSFRPSVACFISLPHGGNASGALSTISAWLIHSVLSCIAITLAATMPSRSGVCLMSLPRRMPRQLARESIGPMNSQHKLLHEQWIRKLPLNRSSILLPQLNSSSGHLPLADLCLNSSLLLIIFPTRRVPQRVL